MKKMPGVSSSASRNNKYYQSNDRLGGIYCHYIKSNKRTSRSPVTSLLASFNKRGHYLASSSLPGGRWTSSRDNMRKKMASTDIHKQDQYSPTGSNNNNNLIPAVSEMDFEPACRMATDWAEVIFFHQGSQMYDPLRVQGSWRKDTLGVSITPDWQPPSPNGCVTTVTRNPRTLLQTPLTRLPLYDHSDSQGDDSDDFDETEDDEEEANEEDESDNEYCPNNYTTTTTSTRGPSRVTPSLPSSSSRPPHSSTTTHTVHNNVTNKTMSLFTATSPLSSCHNIKSLLSSSKFKLLPKSIQLKLTRHLPSSDQITSKQQQQSLSPPNTASNGLDTVLNNEYISASLREWQERLLMGNNLHRKRSRSNATVPQWKESFYENYWGESKKARLNNTQIFYPSSQFSNFTPQQKLIHNTLFKPQTNEKSSSSSSHKSYDQKATPTHKPLPVQLPLQAYAVHCTSQQIMQEHSYYSTKGLNTTLTLIVGSSCNCKTAPLKVCSICHCLYHSLCGAFPKCPSCKR